MLGLAGTGSAGRELAPGPGSAESPGGGGDNGAHSRDAGASAPPPPRGRRLQPEELSPGCSCPPLARAPHFEGRLGAGGLTRRGRCGG